MTETAAANRLRSLMADSAAAYVLISRENSTRVELLVGEVRDVELLAEIPLEDGPGAREVFALVPYRQVRERGFVAEEDDAPLRCIVVEERWDLDRQEILGILPSARIDLAQAEFDITDEDYAEIVRTVIRDEIGHGEGANFVIRRDYTASINVPDAQAILTWFAALLHQERGAYWTFAVVTPGVVLAGASPEAHVIARGGEVTMNPISGTFRHPATGVTRADLVDFLSSTKETEELFMVVDEELKMMSAICSDGGRITGPHLKHMSRLTHTEYMLRGNSKLDPRDILRETMFAPTVTGSPMQNACAVIARHEISPRGYYSGVAALFTPQAGGGHDLDAPILIRTVYAQDGRVRVPVGATLVRHSSPEGEVSETHGKAAGVLHAIGALATPGEVSDPEEPGDSSDESAQLINDPGIAELLASRNARLADFWLTPQTDTAPGPFHGRTALVVDAEDRFTTMLAHQLRHLGLETTVTAWTDVSEAEVARADLIVAGPGPGDPRDQSSARIRRMREIIVQRLATHSPLLAVCLSHQILANELGVSLAPLNEPHQGVQKTVPIFGQSASIGFYNTFTARVDPAAASANVSADPSTGDVYALRGPGYASVQGHLESILSQDGMVTLERLISHALTQ